MIYGFQPHLTRCNMLKIGLGSGDLEPIFDSTLMGIYCHIYAELCLGGIRKVVQRLPFHIVLCILEAPKSVLLQTDKLHFIWFFTFLMRSKQS